MTGLEVVLFTSALAAIARPLFRYLRFRGYLRWLKKLDSDQLERMREMMDAYRDTGVARVASEVRKALAVLVNRQDHAAGSVAQDDEPPSPEPPVPGLPDEGLIIISDSKNPDGPILVLTPDEWRAFASGAQDGDPGESWSRPE